MTPAPEDIAAVVREAWAAFDAATGRGPVERQPIETAPRDGTAIIVGDPDVGEFPMRWGHITRNEVFAPGTVGMWVALDGSMTWTEYGGLGPTAWRDLEAHLQETQGDE